MSLWVIPVRLKPEQAVLNANPHEAFMKVTSFTRTNSTIGPRVLSREPDGSLIVEFRSAVRGLLGRRKVHVTVERVTLSEPYEVTFQGIKGPLDLLSDRFTFAEAPAGTIFTYESTVGFKGSLLGWLLCQTYVRVVLGRFMRQHVEGIKAQFN